MSVIYRLRTLSFRNKFVIVAAVFLVFGLIGAITLSQQQQDTRSRAAGDITGDHPGDLVGDNFRVAGKVLGSIFGNQNQVSNGVQGGIYGTANSINGDVGGCINGDNNRVAGNVSGGVVGTNNIVTGTTGTGPCPNPSAGPTVTTNPSPTVTTAPTFAPTLTIAPTLAPSPTPTNSPTPTGTPVPTAAPTITIPPTATIPPTNISISLRMLLHGIGQGGDSANPNGGGNPNPNRPQRQVTVEIYNTQNQLVLTRQGSVNYNQSAGNFTGIVELGSSFPAGTYTIKIKTAQFLRSLVPGIQNLSNGTVVLPVNAMVVGDVNSDNVLNILDYNIIMGCYSDLAPPVLCSSANAVLSDLDDDGATNQFDYNLFLRELTNRQGE